MHIIMSICSLMAVGCSSNDEPTFVAGQPVTVDFAYTFSSSANPSTTRQVTEVVQPNNAAQPRLPKTMRIITMMDTNPSESEFNWEAPVSKSDPAARFYYTNKCHINTGVNRCLVYGKPADMSNNVGVAPKVYNGVINESFPVSIATAGDIQDINFSLVPIYNIYNNENNLVIPDDASTLAGYLTDVANTTVANTTGWSASENTAIKELRQKFLNKGNNLPGSAASVKAWLGALAAAAEAMITSDSYSGQDAELLNAINSNATTAKAALITSSVTYPRSINLPDGAAVLPDGAAVLRWVEGEKAFKPQMYTTTTVDDINTVSRFAYPASLYYFVNSGISTSMEAVDYKAIYDNPNTTTWEHVLGHFTDGSTVEGGTRSVALTNPVQYAVGQLQVNVQASSATLKDNDDRNVDLNTYSFPLTGIIVGGQRPVDYEFKQTKNTDTEVKFLYDSQVESGCYLSTTSQLGCQTLVLQSYDGEDVDIVLEFENNNDNLTFTGVNGCYVYPHTRFYLVGKIQWTPKQNIVDDKDKRVFTKDHITTVNLTVTTLKKAYNLLPSLLTGHLELGIEVSDWMAATPDVVILK